MPIQFQCPHCQHAMQLPDTAAGKQGKCPKCSRAVTVPAVAAVNPHDEEFWSELDEKKEPVLDEDEAPKPVKKSDAQILKHVLGKVEEAKVVKRIGTPWERPKEGRLFDRFWDTAIGVMNNATETFAEMRLTGGIGGPLKFLLIGALLGALILSVYATAAYAISAFPGGGAASNVAPQADGETGGEAAAGTVVTAAMVIAGVSVFFGIFLGGAIVGIIHVFLQAAGLHLALPIAGVKGVGFEKNFRVAAFTNGSIFLCNIVPVLGAAFMLFLWFNGMMKGLESVYGMSSNKAVLAVLILFVPLVLPIAAAVGFFALRALGYIG